MKINMQSLRNYLTVNGWKRDLDETKQDTLRGLEAIVNVAKIPYDLYRNNKYVNLNTNVLAAAFPSIQAATCASSKMSSLDCSKRTIAAGAAVIDWAIYIPVHITLHYISKGHKFRNQKGRLNTKEFWKDVGKVYLTQVPSIALFYVTAAPLQYGLMKAGFQADNANLISYWGTLIATRSLHTYNYWKLAKK